MYRLCAVQYRRHTNASTDQSPLKDKDRIALTRNTHYSKIIGPQNHNLCSSAALAIDYFFTESDGKCMTFSHARLYAMYGKKFMVSFICANQTIPKRNDKMNYTGAQNKSLAEKLLQRLPIKPNSAI